MTSYEFEVAAKNAVISTVKDLYNEDFAVDQLQITWMAHILGYKKCLLIDNGKNNRYYEVTYNMQTEEMYVDVYHKQHNRCLTKENIKTAVN